MTEPEDIEITVTMYKVWILTLLGSIFSIWY